MEKMGGRTGGYYQTGKEVRGRQVHSNIQQENGLVIRMTKVCT